ncbi:DUF3052 family protein [Pelomonas sp. KK5]|uniref:DUF3052 family protein n=1 Tax=Pelomonas sp. KK5 TaxID=1855730 RepID=UPI00097C4A52|nr:DUF3052 family protein [Pelomonas sp. KK5]
MTTTTGYSGTPLAKKLGLNKPAMLLQVLGLPLPEYRTLLGPLPGIDFVRLKRPAERADVLHLFATEREALAKELAAARKALRDDAVVWVSWPKKAAKVPTTITEDVIRELALPIGFVDIKVCAVSEVWSGLKLMVRREFRA